MDQNEYSEGAWVTFLVVALLIAIVAWVWVPDLEAIASWIRGV